MNTHYIYERTLKTWLFLLSTCLCTSGSFAQEVQFEKTFGSNMGSEALKVLETSDGGLLLVGQTNANTSGLADFHMVKTDAQGEEIWSLTHGGFNNDIPNDAVELPDGGFAIVGFTGSFTQNPSRDIYLIKVDADGNLIWTKSIGGPQTDEGTGILLMPDGGFVLSALTESYGAGGRDAWLIRTDSIGDTLWTQTYGGSEFDDVWEVEHTADGGFILTGGNYSFANGAEDDLWLIKTDGDGNEEWIKNFGVADMLDWGWDLTVVSDGYVAVGLHNNNPNVAAPASGEAHFIKTDLDGNLVWDKSIAHSFRLEATGIDACSDGGFVLSGSKVTGPTSSSFWVTKTDANGKVVWTKDFGVSNAINRAQDLIQTTNGDIVAVGYAGFTQSSLQTMHMVRLTDNSNVGIAKANSYGRQLNVFPNPANGSFSIDLTSLEHEAGRLEILSASTGQTIMSFEPTTAKHPSYTLDTPGLYLIRVFDQEENLLGFAKLTVTP